MSLYVFNVKKDAAIVTADTRMCVDVDGELYRLNDTTDKLHIVDDKVVTIGGVAWLGVYLLEVWKQSLDHSIKHLHELTLAALPYINLIAAAIGAPESDYLKNPYLVEFCILRYDPMVRHNVFYNFATSTGYELLEFHVDGEKRPSAQMFGGIDFDPVQKYLEQHQEQVHRNYISAVKTAYELVTSEKIGGNLLIAKMNRDHIAVEQIPLKDSKPIRDYVVPNGVTYNICGKNLNITCPDVNGGVNKVAIDSLGFFMHNGRYYMSGDGDAGRIGMDSHWGIFGGPKALFDVTDTGYVKPSFVDEDGQMVLDKDGFPKDTDFLLGMKGKHFFRGTIHAEAGKFKGVVQAEDFMLKSGDSMKSILSDKGKILGDYIDARGINILDDDGDPIFYIDKTGIHWTQKHNPIKSQFSTSVNGPWHDDFATNDEYRRDTSDGGTTWSKGYKFVAKDGRDGVDGSDASVTYNNIKAALEKASSLPSAFMTVDEMGAPRIYGGEIYGAKIFAGQSGGVGTGSVISLTQDGIQMRNDENNTDLNITSQQIGTYGKATMMRSGSAGLCLDGRTVFLGTGMGTSSVLGIGFLYPKTYFYGEMDFTKATTTGLHATFA